METSQVTRTALHDTMLRRRERWAEAEDPVLRALDSESGVLGLPSNTWDSWESCGSLE